MQGLTGSGRSRVGVQGAMRARDVSRPSAEDIAEAERTVIVQHGRPVDDEPPPKANPRPRPGGAGRQRQAPRHQPGKRPEAS